MANKVKVLEIIDLVHIVGIKDNTVKVNPFRLYLVYMQRNEYGYYTKRQKQIAKYGDMASLLCMVKDLFCYGIQRKSFDAVITWCKEYYG